VEDVARATVLLLESGITGERFIATAENLSFRNLFTMMAKAFNKRAPYKEATPFLAAVAWRLEKLKSLFTGRAPLLTRETAGLANTKTCFDNSKILHAFNGFSFTPLEISVRDACTRYFSMPAEYRK
jgi:nucleoside-diphosphate-sugar epimerase